MARFVAGIGALTELIGPVVGRDMREGDSATPEAYRFLPSRELRVVPNHAVVLRGRVGPDNPYRDYGREG